jgi:ribosomal-protein-alanine N-acetyltransferase
MTTDKAQAFVRRFLPRDTDAVEELASRSPEAAQWARESYAALNGEGHLAWVAVADGAVCGFFAARIVAGEAEILNLAVDPAKRRAGIANALLTEALRELRGRGAQTVFLEVRESNQAAIRFYEKTGFVQTGRRPGYYQDPSEAAVLMMRERTG